MAFISEILSPKCSAIFASCLDSQLRLVTPKRRQNPAFWGMASTYSNGRCPRSEFSAGTAHGVSECADQPTAQMKVNIRRGSVC